MNKHNDLELMNIDRMNRIHLEKKAKNEYERIMTDDKVDRRICESPAFTKELFVDMFKKLVVYYGGNIDNVSANVGDFGDVYIFLESIEPNYKNMSINPNVLERKSVQRIKFGIETDREIDYFVCTYENYVQTVDKNANELVHSTSCEKSVWLEEEQQAFLTTDHVYREPGGALNSWVTFNIYQQMPLSYILSSTVPPSVFQPHNGFGTEYCAISSRMRDKDGIIIQSVITKDWQKGGKDICNQTFYFIQDIRCPNELRSDCGWFACVDKVNRETKLSNPNTDLHGLIDAMSQNYRQKYILESESVFKK